MSNLVNCERYQSLSYPLLWVVSDINHFHLNCWIRQHRPAGSLCCPEDWRLQWQGLWRKWKTVDSAAVGGRVFSQAITGIWLLCGDASLVTSWKWQSSPGEPHDNMCCQTTLLPQYQNQLWMYGGFYHLSDFVARSTVMTEIEVEIHPACDTKCWVDVRLDRGNIAHYIQFTNHAQKMSQMWLWLAPWRSGELDLAGDWSEIIKIKILFFYFCGKILKLSVQISKQNFPFEKYGNVQIILFWDCYRRFIEPFIV